VPTIFELHRRATNAPAADAWYISRIGGFYRALIASNHPAYGNRYAGIYLEPPGAMSPILPLIASGQRTYNLTTQNPGLPTIPPSVLGMTLLDIDVCHTDFNGYLRAQQIADACVSHLWNFIQSDSNLAGNTTMIVMPEHGRHLFFNGNNPDSLGRSGLDHGQG